MLKWVVIDIETNVVGDTPSDKDEFRVMAWKDNTGKRGVTHTFHDTQRILKEYPIIIGYNIKLYDVPILVRTGFDLRNKIIIDEYEVIKKHIGKLGKLNKAFNLQLSTVAKSISLKNNKQNNFDYDLLKPNDWFKNFDLIQSYALQDIETEYELFLWLEQQLEPFKYGLLQYEIDRFDYMTLSTPSYAYKIICRRTGLKEEYASTDGKHRGKYEGGYVAPPTDELLIGKILEIDFGSAYPHAYMQANLFSNNCTCCKEHEKYSGGHLFKLKGLYCSKQQGIVEITLSELYKERQVLKSRGDKRQLALKLLINIMYGICGHPAFKSVYDLDRASDCTKLGQEWVKYARKRLQDNGYKTVYSDTDSIYVDMSDKDENELLLLRDKIINDIKSSMVFPQSTFNMPIDKRLKLMYMPGKKKKNYLYVTENDEVGVKGLKLIKDDRQRVSRTVFDKYITPIIIRDLTVKVPGSEIKRWVKEEISKDLEQACIYKKVRRDEYKHKTTIQAQIQERHGGGKHKLIPNNKYGVGIGTKLCTIKEYEEQGLTLDDIDIKQALTELSIFTDDNIIPNNNVNTHKKTRVNKAKHNTLQEWLV